MCTYVPEGLLHTKVDKAVVLCRRIFGILVYGTFVAEYF